MSLITKNSGKLKPFLSDKVTTFPQMTLVENEWDNFCWIFENAVHSLGIKTNEYSNDNCDLKNPLEIAIKKYEQHPSINLIKQWRLSFLTNWAGEHFKRNRQAKGCNQLVDFTCELFLYISVAPFTQWFCCWWNDHFHSSWLYLPKTLLFIYT